MPFRAIAETAGDEKLREALVELERARTQEQRARADASALLDALEAMTGAPSPAAAIGALLDRVARVFSAGVAAILQAEPGGLVIATHATAPVLLGARWQDRAGRIAKPRRLIEIDHAALGAPPVLAPYRALMSVPIRTDGPGAAALACFAEERAAFDGRQLHFLGRLASLASQALAAQALWERKTMLAGVIEGSPNAIAILDAVDDQRRIIYVNPSFERLTGYAADTSVGAAWDEVLRGWRLDEDQSTRAAIRERLDLGEAGAFELRNRHRDGHSYWARVNLFPVNGPDRRSRHFVVVQTDITDARKARAERDAARAQLDSALSSTSQGFAVLGARGELAYANAAFARFFPTGSGWQPGEDFARLWAEHRRANGSRPADALAEARRFRDWAYSGDVSHEDAGPDGGTLLVTARRTQDHGAVVTVADITALKRAEARLAERVAAVDAAQDAIALTDAAGRFRYMNPSHLAMFGFASLDEVIGLPWDTLYEPEAAEQIRRDAFPEIARTAAWRGEAIGRRRDGAPIEQELSLTRLPDGGLVCVTRDIAERRRGERERLHLRSEVEVAHRREAVGQIAAGIAHDFNNLLSAIAGSAALAEHALQTGAPVQPHLDRITLAADSGADLMRRLLGLGARERRRVRVELGAALRDVADLVAAGADMRVSVTAAVPDGPIIVDADPSDVLHLALNLAVNARDALGPGGGQVAIALRHSMPRDFKRAPLLGTLDPIRRYAVIAVQDTGDGIAPERAAAIFKPHVSTKGDAGSGLGLAIVAGIVADNDAALLLASAPGTGSTFEVFWPLEAGAPPDEEIPAALSGEPLRGKAVLVAEDCAATLAALVLILERAGAEVGPCDNPLAAAEAIEEDPTAWDLLVTDLEMPGLDGASLAARARAAAPSMPILLCTGAPGSTIDAVREGFDGVLRKPVAPEVLIAAAQRALIGRSEGDH
jgi:PAS domain S-box-containing protein